ncbi:Ig-like domain-containing protein [Janibacter melonis]|uniref:Ig-like domain-containing protein n=1 Tax=Janibacter melonis TaxID=262209 RepID=UPI001919C2C5|nr:Ig-like domain-containing protein [Janibacter melonis]
MSRGAKGGRWAAYGAAAALLLAGCTSGAEGTGSAGATGSGTSGSTDGQTSSTTSAPARPARLKLSPADGARDVMPDQPVTVQAMTGRLDDVTVRTADGSAVEGGVTGSQWTSTGRLAPGSRYSVTTRSTGPDGVERTARSTFRTHEPAVTATYGMVYDGQTVGVAMPVSLQFDSAVTSARYRRAIEKAVTVTTSPRTQGSWGWLDDRQLMWRPKSF